MEKRRLLALLLILGMTAGLLSWAVLGRANPYHGGWFGYTPLADARWDHDCFRLVHNGNTGESYDVKVPCPPRLRP